MGNNPIIIETSGTEISVKAPFNAGFVKDIKESISGARWNSTDKRWYVTIDAMPAILSLLDTHYRFNPELPFVKVHVTAKTTLYGDRTAVYFHGFPVAYAWSRDSGAKVSDGVIKIAGSIKSGGSLKNWDTIIVTGSEFHMYVTKGAAYSDDSWDVKTLD